MPNNEIISGSNLENAIFPLGICAKCGALYSRSNKNPKVPIITFALSAKKKFEKIEFYVFPCGSCRHSRIAQESKYNNEIKLFIIGSNGKMFVIESVKDILPYAFIGDS